MNTVCIGCGVLIPVGSGGRCSRCRPKVRTPQRRIRSSRSWTEFSREVRAIGVCAMCGTTTGPFEADHITPLVRDLTSVKARCLCIPCHRKVTVQR